MASDDLCERGQKLFTDALSTCHTENEMRVELSLLFGDLLSSTQGSELEQPLRTAYDDLHTRRPQRERERETGPNLEQALKAVVG